MPSIFEILLYYPVTAIMWVWHKAFGLVFGESNAFSWVFAIVFLTWSIRALLYKPFVHQVRSMKKMQEFAPEIKKIQKRYANDKQRQAAAMQQLQKEHGVSPLGGCLPILVQVPVFIGLNHVLRSFPIHFYDHVNWGLYTFQRADVVSYMNAKLFGTTLGQAIYTTSIGGASHPKLAGFHAGAIFVAAPLMVAASILTHLTARHSVARQNPASATETTAMVQKLSLYIFPLGLLVFGAFLPIGLLIYFLSNNTWTLMQQRMVYKKIDAEEAERKAEAIEKRSNLGPKPGQKPVKPKKGKGAAANPAAKQQKKGSPNGHTKPEPSEPKTSEGTSSDDDAEIPGMISNASKKKKSGRKRR